MLTYGEIQLAWCENNYNHGPAVRLVNLHFIEVLYRSRRMVIREYDTIGCQGLKAMNNQEV